MAIVGFHIVEDSSTAERVAVAVDEAARGASVLKAVLVEYRKQLGLAGRHVSVGVHKLDERRQPAVGHLHVGVEQHVIVGIDLSQGAVVSFRKTVVLVELQSFHLWEIAFQHLHGVVGRGIVGHPNFRVAARVFHNGGQVLAHHLAAVPVQYDDCYVHLFNVVCCVCLCETPVV